MAGGEVRTRTSKLEVRRSRAEGRPFAGVVAGPRIILRRWTEGDLASIEAWFGRALGLATAGAAAKLAELREEAEADPARWVLSISESPGRPVGVLAFRAPWPSDGWLGFELVVLAEEARGRGLALEAVTVVEGEARSGGLAGAFAAPVRAEFGRALYFWLRLGYRPLLRSRLPFRQRRIRPGRRPGPGGADFGEPSGRASGRGLSRDDLWLVRDEP